MFALTIIPRGCFPVYVLQHSVPSLSLAVSDTLSPNSSRGSADQCSRRLVTVKRPLPFGLLFFRIAGLFY